MARVKVHPVETVALADLTPHPRNYRDHPEDQVAHLVQSISEHGFYRNLVIAKDNTILAGHGIALAAAELNLKQVPAVRMNIGPNHPLALKILAADNYLSHFSMDDDRMLTELLKDISELDTLLGTGFDEANLALLAMVTRPASELQDFDAAAEWLGMPEFNSGEARIGLTLFFDSETERQAFIDDHGILITSATKHTKAGPWPPAPRVDRKSVLVEG